MKRFQVWIRPVGDFCRIRVDGDANARWLVLRLSEAFVFRTFEPLEQNMGTTHCSFRVPYNPPLSSARLRQLLLAIPEVDLMREPA
jgi:hypothetical protein